MQTVDKAVRFVELSPQRGLVATIVGHLSFHRGLLDPRTTSKGSVQ